MTTAFFSPLLGTFVTQRSISLGHDFSKAESILQRNSKSHENLKPISDSVKKKIRLEVSHLTVPSEDRCARPDVLTLKSKDTTHYHCKNPVESQVKVNSTKTIVRKRPTFTRTKAISHPEIFQEILMHFSSLEVRLLTEYTGKHQNQQGLDQSGHRRT